MEEQENWMARGSENSGHMLPLALQEPPVPMHLDELYLWAGLCPAFDQQFWPGQAL